MPESIILEPIGHVRVGAAPETVKTGWEALVSRIQILPEHQAGLTGIDGFSRLIVLFFMHELSPGARATHLVKPRGLLRFGLRLEDLPTIGIFACDSPARPNPIGVSVVQLLSREGPVLTVRGLDAFDGTPVLDIKPYTADRAVPDARMPQWHTELLRASGSGRV